MCMIVCVCACVTCACVCMCTYILYECVTFIHTYSNIHTYIHILPVRMHIHKQGRRTEATYLHIHKYIHIHIHTHTHTYKSYLSGDMYTINAHTTHIHRYTHRYIHTNPTYLDTHTTSKHIHKYTHKYIHTYIQNIPIWRHIHDRGRRAHARAVLAVYHTVNLSPFSNSHNIDSCCDCSHPRTEACTAVLCLHM